MTNEAFSEAFCRGDMFQQQREHEERWKLFLMTMRLARWLHVVARRAEVAGLVRAADQATADMIDLHDDIDAVDDAIKRHNSALGSLARLAGGGE